MMIENKIYNEALKELIPYVTSEGKTFLVTGATGLIGSCAIDLLMLANNDGKKNHIYALGRNKEKIINRFKTYKDNSFFHLIDQDICEPLDNKLQFDYIVHGASNADPIAYAKYPAETMIINLLGGYNILEYGRIHKKCKIVMLSTFEVYGKAHHDIYLEEDSGIIDFNSLRACYPESKRSMEILSRCYFNEYGVHVNVARLCSIYGPTMTNTDSKAHAQFIRRALERKSIVLKSKGEQLRTYCYVLDTISGLFTILFKGKAGESYNVSNENSIVSIADIAQTLSKIAGVNVVYEQPSELEAKGYSKPQDIILDNKKIKSLGWSPIYDIQKGMKQTFNILKKE